MTQTQEPKPETKPVAKPEAKPEARVEAISTFGAYYERIQKILGESRKALLEVLPPSLGVDRYIRTALTLWRTDPKIQNCEPMSFSGVVLEAANLHLSLDPSLGQAFVIPRRQKAGANWITVATLLVGYPGIVKEARDSGQVIDFTAMLVREGDRFDFALGTEKFLRHSWDLVGQRGKMIGGYLYVRLTSGEQHLFLMTADQLREAKERVLADNGIYITVDEQGREHAMRRGDKGDYETDSPWVTDEEPMMVKTLIRRGSKTIPLGDAYTRAVALDEAQDHGRPQNLIENLRGILPEASGAPQAPDDAQAQAATAAAAAALAEHIRAQAAAGSPQPPDVRPAAPPPPAVASASEPNPALAPQSAQEPPGAPPKPPAAPADVPPVPATVEPFVGPPSGMTEEELAEQERSAFEAGVAARDALAGIDPEVAAMQRKLDEAKARKGGRKPARPKVSPVAPVTTELPLAGTKTAGAQGDSTDEIPF
jgi:recombination protein RecT